MDRVDAVGLVELLGVLTAAAAVLLVGIVLVAWFRGELR